MRDLLTRMLQCSVTLLNSPYAKGPGHNPIIPPIGRFLPLTGPHLQPGASQDAAGLFFFSAVSGTQPPDDPPDRVAEQNGREQGRKIQGGARDRS